MAERTDSQNPDAARHSPAENLDEAAERLDELIADYIDRLIAGEKLSRDELKARHPDLADQILSELDAFVELDTTEPPSCVRTLGDYTLRRQIGRGGMGVVYEAWQGSLDRRVALKVLPIGVAADTRASSRFLREAQVAAKLSHPLIVPVYGFGVEQSTPYFAMELVEGETLAQVLTRLHEAEETTDTPFGPRSDQQFYLNIAQAFADVADGLQHAHASGVIHRDIKPSNLILDPEGDRGGSLKPERSGGGSPRLRILDFGLARLEGQESLTISGDVVGTLAYMSPEQAGRRKIQVDQRTDIYSLGATLYELLSGQQPFRGNDYNDTLSQILEQEPRPPRQLNRRVPVDLETIVLKCLRKNAGERYGTAEALGQDLRRFVRGDPIEAESQTVLERAARRLWKQRRLATGVVAVLVVALVSSLVANVLVERARDDAEGARNEAEAARDEARYDLYVSNMRLAMEDWRAGNVSRRERLLDSHEPGPEQPDLRGWEWYYLSSLRRDPLLSLVAHSDKVESIAWSPDGEQLATASYDGTVRIWEAASGTEVLSPFDLGVSVAAVAWGPDGRLATATDPTTRNQEVRLWDLKSQQQIPLPGGDLLKGARWRPKSVSFSPNGRWLAAGDFVDGVRVWDMRDTDHPGPRTLPMEEFCCGIAGSLSWTRDSRRLAATSGGLGSTPGFVKVWDTETWRKVSRLDGHTLPVCSSAWSPDGRQLASASWDETVRVWNLETGTADVLRGHVGYVYSVSWNPDGRLASSGADGTVKIWNPSENTAPRTFGAHSGRVYCVTWSPDGRRLASGGIDGAVKLWDSVLSPEAETLPGRGRAAFSPDGHLVAAEGEESGTVSVFNLSTGDTRTLVRENKDELTALAWSPDGRQLAVGGRYRRLQIWETTGWQKLPPIDLESLDFDAAVISLAWSPHVFSLASGVRRGRVKVWDTTGREVTELQPWTGVALAFSPCGRRLAAQDHYQYVRVFDTADWHEVFKFSPHPYTTWDNEPANSLGWSPEGDQLVAGSSEGALIVRDAATWEILWEEQDAHALAVTNVAWSPDGRRLATGSRDQSVKLWDAETGRELITLRGHKGTVLSVAWHPDGEQLMTSDRESVKIWRAPGYQAVAAEQDRAK